MSNKRLFFWIVIAILLAINGGILLFEKRLQKPQAGTKPSGPTASSTNTSKDISDLLPQPAEPQGVAQKLSFSKEEAIFSFSDNSGYIYKFPGLVQKNDYYLFLGRGKNSDRINEIVFLRSKNLKDWGDLKMIKREETDPLIDLEVKQINGEFHLVYIFKKEGKNNLLYLTSVDANSWKKQTLPLKSDEEYLKANIEEDGSNIRLFLLPLDRKTITQFVYIPGKGWQEVKNLIKLNLKVNDFAFVKRNFVYYLLFSIDNELYLTSSTDLHSFKKSENLFSISSSDFSLDDKSLVYSDSSNVYKRNY